jgi:hypothetical protein
MKRSFTAFLAVVLLPSGIAMAVVGGATASAEAKLHHSSAARVARLALGALDQELGRTVDSLLTSAVPLPAPDTTVPAVRRALGGDTVMALDPTASGIDVLVLFQDPVQPGTLRFAQSSRVPRVDSLVARRTAFGVTLFVNGTVWGDDTTTVSLDREVRLAAADATDGIDFADGVLVAMDPRPGLPAAISVLAEPERQPTSVLSRPVWIVVAVLFLFVLLAGWIHLSAPDPNGNRVRSRAVGLALLTAIPLLSVVALAVTAADGFESKERAALSADIIRGVNVADALDMSTSPSLLRQMTGFHAVRVRGGEVLESTFSGPVPAVAALPAPPPSFTASGLVDTPEGPGLYVARRVEPGETLVTIALGADARSRHLRGTLHLTLGLLVVWLVLAGGWMTGRRENNAGAEPE